MKTYKCTVCSPSCLDRDYEVATTSALKCAKVLGRAEAGETVTVYHGQRMLSCVKWDSQSGKYIRVQAFNRLCDVLPWGRMAIIADDLYAYRTDIRYANGDCTGGVYRENIQWLDMFKRIGYGLVNLLPEGEANHRHDEPVTCCHVMLNGKPVQVFLPASWQHDNTDAVEVK